MPRPAVGAAAAAQAMFTKDSELDKAQQQVLRLDGRLVDTERLLDMPFSQRRNQVRTSELRDRAWNAGSKTHSAIIAHACIFFGAAGGAGGLFLGYNTAVGAIGGLVGSAALYIGVVKHFVLPRQVDGKVVKALKTEKSQLEGALVRARERLDEVRTKTVEELQDEPPTPGIEVEEARVVIGGVALKVRR